VLTWLEGTQYAALVRSDSLWGWPLALTVHAFGTALVVGLIFIVSLRMMGLFETIPYKSLNKLFPAIWFAIALQFISGAALWITKPNLYLSDLAFMLKFALLIVGVILTAYFYGTIKREAPGWDATQSASPRGIRFTAATLFVWCCVLIAGRLTAYLGSLG
jgi:hypothetical protein